MFFCIELKCVYIIYLYIVTIKHYNQGSVKYIVLTGFILTPNTLSNDKLLALITQYHLGNVISLSAEYVKVFPPFLLKLTFILNYIDHGKTTFVIESTAVPILAFNVTNLVFNTLNLSGA